MYALEMGIIATQPQRAGMNVRDRESKSRDTDSAEQHGQEKYGYALILTSVAFYSTMRVCMRLVTAYEDMPVSATMFLWGATQVTLGLVLAMWHGFSNVFKVTSAQVRLLALRAAFGAASLCMLQHAYKLLPVATATAVFFLNPVFTLIIGFFVLGEPVAITEKIGAALSLVGAILVARPTNNGDFNGLCAGLAAAILAACAYTALRAAVKGGEGAHYVAAVLAFGVAVCVTGVVSGGVNALVRTRAETFRVAQFGSIAGFLAMCALSRAYRYCRAGTGAVLRKADVPLVFILGAFVLNEIPRLLDIVGSALIVGGTIIVASVPYCFGVDNSKIETYENVPNTNSQRTTSAV